MDNRAIGVFDSGLGGLTAVRRFMELLPREDIIYLGDTGRVPYGSRSRETIIRYAREDIDYLLRFDIKVAVIACGTVSTTALDAVKGAYKLPLYGIVEATAEKAVRESRTGRIGVIATNATIRSGAFEREIRRIDNGIEVISRACPLFVPLVENGRISKDDIVIKTVTEEYLKPLKEQRVDTLVLACTHYPLLDEVIRDYMGDVVLVDSGAEIAEKTARFLREYGKETGKAGEGQCRFYVTDETEGFSESASLFLKREIHADVTRVELTDKGE